MNWKPKPGAHELVERAYDATGNVGTSAAVTVEAVTGNPNKKR
jgi:hypothetical protein